MQAELEGNAAFQAAIGYSVPDNWPPELYGHDAINWTLRMLASAPDVQRWAVYYVIEIGAEGGTVVAETYPHLTASIAIMQNCGLTFLGEGSEAGVIRFQLLKAR